MRFIHRSITITTIPIACLAILISCGGEPTTPPVSPPPPPQQQIPITGAAMPGMESFENSVGDIMGRYNIPGGAVALVRDGKLIYARGFGYADVENKTAVQPDALFRIASISKPITSAAGSYYNVSWVALFNAGVSADVGSELDVALWDALGKVTSFPTHDLFSTFR